MMVTRLFVFWVFLLVGVAGSGCYSFKGFSIDPNIETFRVDNFQLSPSASIAPPTMGIEFAQKLSDKIRGETRLKLNTQAPDIIFEGKITGFSVRTVAPQPGEVAGANQLQITVEVDYTDTKNDVNNWKQSWTQQSEFPAEQDLLTVQNSLIDEISKRLLEDIFNKSFNNW